MKNRLESFTPLMHFNEYKFIEKFLKPHHTFFEWGAGNGTLYFSGLVNKLISLEHDIDFYNQIKITIDLFNADNIDLIYVKPNSGDRTKSRYEQFKDYVDYPVVNNLDFDICLIDGRARKDCARVIHNYIKPDTIVFVHDFNHNDVEGYEDKAYFEDILSIYDVVEYEKSGRGIIALKRKENDLFSNKE
jgi:tRNA A58 N-methylase Trm61